MKGFRIDPQVMAIAVPHGHMIKIQSTRIYNCRVTSSAPTHQSASHFLPPAPQGPTILGDFAVFLLWLLIKYALYDATDGHMNPSSPDQT